MSGPALDAGAADFLVEAARRVGVGYPDLYDHQRTGVAFLLSRRKAILADDMGLGKTRTAIVAAREQSPDGRILVVCPASMKFGWRREIRSIEPDAAVDVLERDVPAKPARWTVVNYDRLTKFASFLETLSPDVVVIDEAHAIKNKSARTTRVFGLLARSPQAAVYLLTGTPMTNRPRDLYNLLKAVEHPVSRSFYSFARRYCNAHDNGFGLDTNGASNMDELARLVSGVMLRRTKDEALDLPEKVRSYLPLGVEAKRTRSLESRALSYLAQNPARGGTTWVTFLGMLNKARHELAVAKSKESVGFVDDLVEAGQKVVVFSSYQAVVDRFVEHFGAAAVSITGAVSAEDRDAAVQRFQSDETVRVFVGNLLAAGTGVTLTAGTHVVFNDLDWVPANHWQAEDRVYRIGQHATTFATYLYCPGTLDEFVAALLEQKAQLIGVIEEEAEARSSLVGSLVTAALEGVDVFTPEPAKAVTTNTMGLLEETLGLLEQFKVTTQDETQQGLEIHRFPSSSTPGKEYVVEVLNGVARCDCPGFSYRGNCAHTRKAIGS